jgi:SHS2 domain-containing protein
VRWALPQPYEDLDHTADVGVRVRGATREEALARLVLAYAALLAGGGAVAPETEERIVAAAAPGAGSAGAAVELLRELLFRFATERKIPAAVELARAGPDRVEATVAFGRHDPDLHAEGLDLKAVTWHAARLERDGDHWTGQVVFDI